MKLRTSIYKQDASGDLHFVTKGECLMYAPQMARRGKSNSMVTPYVALNFGAHRVHINREDFTKFCERFLKFGV